MKLLNQFYQFCKAQPDDRHVDHSMTWSECAVGDFSREVLDGKIDPQRVSLEMYREYYKVFGSLKSTSLSITPPGASAREDGTYKEMCDHLEHNFGKILESTNLLED